MNIEWDENKSVENVQKHGVSFEFAQQAFFDTQRKIYADKAHSKVEGKIVTVRFTVRKDKIRIIGAGFWRKGRKAYHEG